MKFTTVLFATLSLATLGLASPFPQDEPEDGFGQELEPCDKPSCNARCGKAGVLVAVCAHAGGTNCVCNSEGDPGFGKGKPNKA